jgi:anaerobic glycerol-3-phosphate dehydrogenase
MLDNFVDYMTTTTENVDKTNIPKDNLYQTTKGDWTYISAAWIIQCYTDNKLVDPKDHLFNHRSKHPTLFVRHKVTDIPRQLQRQIDSKDTDLPGQQKESLLAMTALRRYRRAVAAKDLPQTIILRARKQKEKIIRVIRPARVALYNFNRHFMQTEKARRKRLHLSKLRVSTVQREAADKWRNLTQRERDSWVTACTCILCRPRQN